jgi:hypothetical protein
MNILRWLFDGDQDPNPIDAGRRRFCFLLGLGTASLWLPSSTIGVADSSCKLPAIANEILTVPVCFNREPGEPGGIFIRSDVLKLGDVFTALGCRAVDLKANKIMETLQQFRVTAVTESPRVAHAIASGPWGFLSPPWNKEEPGFPLKPRFKSSKAEFPEYKLSLERRP